MDLLKKHRNKKITGDSISGDRIILREIRKTDLQSCMIWLNDPGVTMFLSSSAKNPSRDEELKWFRSIKRSKNDIVFSIVTGPGNNYIGNCGLHKINWQEGTCETGIFIGNRSYWNRGFGTSFMKILLNFATDTLGLKKIKLFVYEYNSRAKRVYEKCGFTLVDILKENHLYENKYYDTFVMEYNKAGEIAF